MCRDNTRRAVRLHDAGPRPGRYSVSLIRDLAASHGNVGRKRSNRTLDEHPTRALPRRSRHGALLRPCKSRDYLAPLGSVRLAERNNLPTPKMGQQASTVATSAVVAMTLASILCVSVLWIFRQDIVSGLTDVLPERAFILLLGLIPAQLFGRTLVGLARAIDRFDLANWYQLAQGLTLLTFVAALFLGVDLGIPQFRRGTLEPAARELDRYPDTRRVCSSGVRPPASLVEVGSPRKFEVRLQELSANTRGPCTRTDRRSYAGCDADRTWTDRLLCNRRRNHEPFKADSCGDRECPLSLRRGASQTRERSRYGPRLAQFHPLGNGQRSRRGIDCALLYRPGLWNRVRGRGVSTSGSTPSGNHADIIQGAFTLFHGRRPANGQRLDPESFGRDQHRAKPMADPAIWNQRRGNSNSFDLRTRVHSHGDSVSQGNRDRIQDDGDA